MSRVIVYSTAICLLYQAVLGLSAAEDGFGLIKRNFDEKRKQRLDPEVDMNVTQLITSKGYPCEEYNVHTTDGYILGIQRILHGKGHRDSGRRAVVLLQHGLLSSSADWVDNLVNQSLGFLLADAGFDVWLGNSRGNTYGRKHERLSPESDQFWDFSWDEMAKYDLPATIQKVLEVTQAQSLLYIGHSQGTEIVFAQLSQTPELASRIRLFVALAPVAYLDGVISPFRLLAPLVNYFELMFGVREFLPSNNITKWLAKNVCTKDIPALLCENILFLLGGYDAEQMNTTRIPVYTSHSPAGTSVKNIIHYAQAVESGKFQMFDYGHNENRRRYNQSDPPVYNPSKVGIPVALFSGPADWLSVPPDVTKLKKELPKVVLHKIIDKWAHLDFVWAMDSPTVCYKDVIELLGKYSI